MPGLPPPPPRTEAKRPPPTPISAGAFSFSVGPTPKRAKTKLNNPPSSTRLETPLKPVTGPSRFLQTPVAAKQGTYTPTKTVYHTLDSLPSPLSFLHPPKPYNPGPGQRKEGHRRLNDILDESSPFRPVSPVKTEDEGKKIRIGDIPSSLTQEVKRREVVREDEGIGVSPRKARGIKWTGKGAPPPSFQLAALLQSSNSSLLLFYTSLQRTLHPPQPARKPQTPSRNQVSAAHLPPAISTAPTPFQHLRTAPMVLEPTRVAVGRTHHGLMIWCGLRRSQQTISDTAIDVGPTEDSDPFTVGPKNNTAGTALIVFQSLPHECPRLGVDPRLVIRKMSEGEGKNWEVGVWGPWTEIEVPISRAEVGYEAEKDESEEWRTKLVSKSTKALFVSRYLIASA